MAALICVSIGRGRHKMMMAEHRHLASRGAQLVELRLDYIRRAVDLKRLLSDRPCPIVATCRRKQDGGLWTGSEQDRMMVLRTAIADGVEYVDLEEDIAASIPRYGKTRRIISYHNFRETPDEIDSIHARLKSLDADVVKLATMANQPHDNLRMLKLIQESDVPTVSFCMGEIGTPSRILQAKFGAPFTYATFHTERQLAPGQLSYDAMVSVYHYESIDPDTHVYGVVADPVGHSLSPVIHNAVFREKQMNCVYLPFRVPREFLGEFLGDCRPLGVKGLSVTIPHKEQVLHQLDEVDGAVSGIGASNTVIFNGPKNVGYNTDFHAAMESLERATGERAGNPLAQKKVLVLGAGGVAKAVAFGLRRRDADVVIASRTKYRSDLLARKFDCRAVEWRDRYNQTVDIVVNATPLGMHPKVDVTPYDQKYLNSAMIVFDTVYNPEQTLLVKQARGEGCRVVTGVDMFVRQAEMQFKYFTGDDPPADLMRAELKRATSAAKF